MRHHQDQILSRLLGVAAPEDAMRASVLVSHDMGVIRTRTCVYRAVMLCRPDLSEIAETKRHLLKPTAPSYSPRRMPALHEFPRIKGGKQ